MPAVAITDHGTLFGVLDFYQKARAAGIKPLLGCELYVAPGSRQEKTGKGENRHLVVLAENLEGYHNLIRLVTHAHQEGFYYRPRVDKDLLRELNGGLIALSSCLHGVVAPQILNDDLAGAEASAREYAEIFKDRFYLEVQANNLPEQLKVNAALLELGPRWGLPVVGTNDVHYLKSADARAHDVLLCIQTGKTVNTSSRMKFHTDQLYFKSPAEMARIFPDPAVLAASAEIAARCQVTLELGTYHFPAFPAPEGESMESLLTRLARRGWRRGWRPPPPTPGPRRRITGSAWNTKPTSWYRWDSPATSWWWPTSSISPGSAGYRWDPAGGLRPAAWWPMP